jgi:hypothetical protein
VTRSRDESWPTLEDGEAKEACAVRVRTALVGRVFLAYWLLAPDAGNVAAVVAALPSARATAGAPLIFCAYVPDGVGPPAAEVRKLIIELTPKMLESCASIHTVQGGAGEIAMAFRAVARAMVIIGGYRGKVFIHGSLEDFLATSYGELGVLPSLVRSEIERMGTRSMVPAT